MVGEGHLFSLTKYFYKSGICRTRHTKHYLNILNNELQIMNSKLQLMNNELQLMNDEL